MEFKKLNEGFNHLVLVERVELIEETDSGIVIPQTARFERTGRVVLDNDTIGLKKGDIVLYVPNSGGKVSLYGKIYVFLYNNEIICKLEDVKWQEKES